MENLTIYNVYVEMTSQEQCDRMKKLCIDNNLPIWEDEIAFIYNYNDYGVYDFYEDEVFSVFEFNNFDSAFAVYLASRLERWIKTKVTEEQFIKLLKNK